ncbi:MAG: MFS transporter, partial [bacterium]|nr:MFS transporter [bacterium]
MERRRVQPDWAIATIIAAALALLQPGIDPVFLTLLSAASGLDPVYHGWIVGATQGGMAIGAVGVWLAGPRLPRAAVPLAAVVALGASIATTGLDMLAALVAVRALYGAGMGIVYTQAMSDAAARRP